MGDVETQRTLVKSVPELWAELSGTPLLGRMLGGPFGEIRITRLTPESRIDWEAELAAGSVELTPSGFGTRVRLTAQLAEPQPPPQGLLEPQRPSLWERLAALFRARSATTAEPRAEPAPDAPPAPEPVDPGVAEGALTAVLDEIGTARHRPFSRRQGTL
jgi:hypothetical protein